MKSFWKRKWNVVLYFVILFVSLFFVYLASRSGEDYQFKKYDQLEFATEWNYQFSDGTSGITELPANLEVEEADSLVLTNTLPTITEKVTFVYRSRHTVVKVYVDDILVYDQSAGENGTVEDTVFPLSGNIWNEMTLMPEDSGKEIKIVSQGTIIKYLSSPGDVFLGERGTFLMKVVHDKMGTIVGAVLLVLLSEILFILWIVLTCSTHARYNECLCLAIFTFTVALWEFTETRCLQFFFSNAKAPSIFAFEVLTLAPVPIALYFTYGKSQKTTRRGRIAATIPLVLWIINNILHFTHVCDIAETLILTQIMIAFETVFLGFIQISDLLADHKMKGKGEGGIFWWVPSLGFVMLGPILLAEVMKYITNSTIKYNDNAMLTTVGIVFYILSLAIHSSLKLASENFIISEASEAKTNFLANTSHDIRTPLNAILGFNEMILRDSEEAKTKEYALSIKNAGASLLDIINNILDLSKIESGKIELQETEYSTVCLLDNVTSIIMALAQTKGLYLKVDIDEKLPQCLIGDQIRIRQVLINLLNNAVKYTKKGGVIFKVKLLEEDEEHKSCKILFSIIDTGIGIREEDKGRMFKKFERLDFEQNRNVEGTGLGMSIVVKLLESMDSKIELKSIYGKGSNFYFVLNQRIADNAGVGSYEEGKRNRSIEKEQREHYMAPDARILVVDDVRLNLQVTKGLLEGMKMHIDLAESGEEAIQLVKDHCYDIILMDHMMPGMDGIVATKKIRKLAEQIDNPYFKEVPIIALTANAIAGMREKFIEEGMQDYISKPVEEKTLEDTILKWLPKEKLVRKEKAKDSPHKNEKNQTKMDLLQEDWDIEIPGMDIESAKIYLLNKEMYLDTLRIFFESVPDIRKKIIDARNQRNEEDYTVTVHGLKSSAKIIGAIELSEEAKRLEDFSHQGRVEQAWSETDHLLEIYERFERAIASYLKVEKEEDKTAFTREEFKQSLIKLKTAAEKFNMETFFAWEKETEKMTAPEDYQIIWHKLRDAVRNVAFSDTIEIVNKALAEMEEKK